MWRVHMAGIGPPHPQFQCCWRAFRSVLGGINKRPSLQKESGGVSPQHWNGWARGARRSVSLYQTMGVYLPRRGMENERLYFCIIDSNDLGLHHSRGIKVSQILRGIVVEAFELE